MPRSLRPELGGNIMLDNKQGRRLNLPPDTNTFNNMQKADSNSSGDVDDEGELQEFCETSSWETSSARSSEEAAASGGKGAHSSKQS